MNEKIYAVMQRIIESPSEIKDIYQSSNEYFFTYKGIFLSILKSERRERHGPYSLYLYPKYEGDIGRLAAQFEFPDDNHTPMIAYHFDDTDIARDQQLFAYLYRAVESKYLNLDEIFDQLLEE